MLREYLDNLYIAYLDDIFIYFVDLIQYTNNVRTVFKRFLKYGLFVKLEKYVFYIKKNHF